MRVRLLATGEILTIRPEEFDPAKHGRLAEQIVSIPMQTRAAPVRAGTWNGDERTIDVTFSTGAQVRRFDYMTDEEWLEELSLEPADVNLDEINNGAPVLNVHWRYDLEDVLGVVERGWLEAEPPAAAATLRYSERDSIAGLVGDIASGIIRNVSVGYSVERYEEVTPEGADLRVFRAVEWTPREISNVPIGADSGAGTRAGTVRSFPCTISRAIPAPRETGEATTMQVRLIATGAIIEIRAEDFDETIHSKDLTGGRAPEVPAAQLTPAEVATARREGAETERLRQVGIRTAVRATQLGDDVADELIGRGDLTLEGARAEVLERLAVLGDENSTRTAAAIPIGGLDENVTRREGIASALLHRYDPRAYPVSEAGRDWVGLSLMEIARACLEAHGERLRGASKMKLVERALLSGSDLPAVVENIANKTLRDAYTGAPRTFTAWCRPTTLPDFKQASRVQFGSVPALEAVGTGGEFHYAAVGDAKEVYALATYGRIVAITRQVIINDDLGAMTRIPQLYGRAAADLESNLVYTILTSNPAMADTVALFDDAGHGNYITTGTVISIANLGIARAKMRIQKGLLDDSVLNLAPLSLMVPAALETLAQQMTAPVNEKLKFVKSEEINPFAGTLNPIVEARLDAASTTAWYLACDPAQCDTIEYGYLEGQEGVYLENRVGFNVDGVEMKARLDFGAKAIDWRGLFKNDGA